VQASAIFVQARTVPFLVRKWHHWDSLYVIGFG